MTAGEPRSRMVWLDYARGVAIVGVLVLHLTPTVSPGASLLLRLPLFVLHYLVCDSAVPIFMVASLFLVFLKHDAWRRFKRLGIVFGFWLSVQYALWVAIHQSAPPLDFGTITQGGPALSGTGPTLLYFLFDLMCLSAVAGLVLQIERRSARSGRLLSWVLLLAPVLSFIPLQLVGYELPQWAIWNFVPCVGIAYFFSRDRAPRLPWLALTGAIALVAVEKMGSLQSGAMPEYGRASILLVAVVIFGQLAARKAEELWAVRPVTWMGRHSLGMYALHLYAAAAVAVFARDAHWAVAAGLTTALTVVVVWLLAKSPLARFVR